MQQKSKFALVYMDSSNCLRMNIEVWAFVSHLSFKLQKAVMPSTLENRKYAFYYTKKIQEE